MRNCSTHNMNMSWTYLVQCNNTATHQNMPSCLLHVKPLHLHWVGRESHEKRIKCIRLGPYHETFLMLARNFVCFTLCRVYATNSHKYTHGSITQTHTYIHTIRKIESRYVTVCFARVRCSPIQWRQLSVKYKRFHSTPAVHAHVWVNGYTINTNPYTSMHTAFIWLNVKVRNTRNVIARVSRKEKKVAFMEQKRWQSK